MRADPTYELACAVAASRAFDVRESEYATELLHRAIGRAENRRAQADADGFHGRAAGWGRRILVLRRLLDVVCDAEEAAIRIDRDAHFAAAARARLRQGQP